MKSKYTSNEIILKRCSLLELQISSKGTKSAPK